MRSKSSSKMRKRSELAMARTTTTTTTTTTTKDDQPHLSGAYIRSLVKQLSSSRLAKDHATGSTNPNPNPTSPDEEAQPQLQPPPPPPPPPPPKKKKKQVRRRLHTSRPYQERLLNMAEARREIVTALKFHRASMKQANKLQHHQQPPPPPLESSRSTLPNPNPNFHVFPSTYTESTAAAPSAAPFQYPPLAWSYPPFVDNFNLPFPNQPLGLNLNIQGFNNIKNPHIIMQPTSPPSSSSSSYSSSSSSPSTALSVQVPVTAPPTAGAVGMKLHPVMGEEEMAEIRTIGEKHDIEWNDTVNLVTSAWWSSFLETIEEEEVEVGCGDPGEDKLAVSTEESTAGIPTWFGGDADGSHLLMHHLDEYYLQDASLPCFDIGEIEGLEGEWLS